jgi:acetyl esterase/lipase
VAGLGFVVFNASWGQEPGGAGTPTFDVLDAVESQAACAIEFARPDAATHGGDPDTMIVFGHSGGAHAAALATFARPAPTAGCLGGTTLGAIAALVTWEGNWLLSVNCPDWDGALAADPRVMDAMTPWTHLAGHADQKVVMLVSENPGTFFEREAGDPWAADSWLAVRDPSGDLRRQLEANGAFADGTLDFVEVQQLLFSVLEARGNPVSLDVMPDSIHDHLGGAGWPVFLAAFPKAAAED